MAGAAVSGEAVVESFAGVLHAADLEPLAVLVKRRLERGACGGLPGVRLRHVDGDELRAVDFVEPGCEAVRGGEEQRASTV